jgi:hypothetical protein
MTPLTPPQSQSQPESLIVDQLLQKDPAHASAISRLTLTRAIKYCVRERFDELIHALSDNETVTTLYLGPYFYASLSDAQRSLFCETVGRECHQLKVWTITTLDLTTACFSGNAMGRALSFNSQQSNNTSVLQTLRIERTLLMEDVKMLAAGFSHHPTLRRVTLPRLSLQRVNVMDTGTDIDSGTGVLDPLLLALATIPHLEAVELGLDENCLLLMNAMTSFSGKDLSTLPHVTATMISPAALATLASHPTLTWLVVRRFQLQDAHVQALSTALAHAPCSHLKDLDLSTNNRTSSVHSAAARLTDVSWQAVVDMLASNTRLETVRLPPQSSGATAVTSKRLVSMYLRLNRKGRGRLWSVSNTGTSVENEDSSMTTTTTTASSRSTQSAVASIDDWWPVLADLSDDLTAIWILLRGNPMLCLNAGGGAGDCDDGCRSRQPS